LAVRPALCLPARGGDGGCASGPAVNRSSLWAFAANRRSGTSGTPRLAGRESEGTSSPSIHCVSIARSAASWSPRRSAITSNRITAMSISFGSALSSRSASDVTTVRSGSSKHAAIVPTLALMGGHSTRTIPSTVAGGDRRSRRGACGFRRVATPHSCSPLPSAEVFFWLSSRQGPLEANPSIGASAPSPDRECRGECGRHCPSIRK